MPADVDEALRSGGALGAYRERPAYQRNDYLGWIGQAQREVTRANRVRQMVDELRQGGVYMGMPHAPSRRVTS
jgi:uncharacterized protein YdeI (YjbR/CyaY-like superfamily)